MKTIEFMPGYTVSEHGVITSLNYRRTNRSQVRKLRKRKDGYLDVQFKCNGKPYNKSVHRLVAEAFLSNPDSKRTVNHINGIKTDNRVENLEWATHSENNKHAYAMGLNNGCR